MHYRLAELQTEIEAVRSLLYRAVIERLSGKDVTMLASMGKLKASRLVRTVTDSCLQVDFGSFFSGNYPSFYGRKIKKIKNIINLISSSGHLEISQKNTNKVLNLI